jgi:CIC family chloride channel protein
LGSGGSAGREGPIVHIGAAIGSLLGKFFKIPVRRLRTFVGCGAAAGIAATFNAPIAGALFAGEVILGQFGVVSFSAIVISSVVATVISRHFMGDLPAFIVPTFHLQHTYELFFYAAVGLLAALIGCLFIWLLENSNRVFGRIKIPEYVKPSLGGLLVGAMALMVPGVLGVGYGTVNSAMHASLPCPAGNCVPLTLFMMMALLIGKLLATSLTLGSGGSGGVFAPSLFLGAMLGALMGTGLEHYIPGQIGGVGSYALVAMGAMVAATTRAPITAIIIIFELTNNYTIVLPLMVACILATLVANKMVEPSIYHLKLLRKGIDLIKDQDVNVLRRLTVNDVRMEQQPFIKEGVPLTDILELVMNHGALHYVVVDEQERYRGVIHLSELSQFFTREEVLEQLIVAADVMHVNVPAVVRNDNLGTALRLLGEADTDVLVVVDSRQSKNVLGVITHDGVIDTYNSEVQERDWASNTAGLVVAAERMRTVDLGEGTSLMEVEVPGVFIGQCLKDLNLRQKYNVQVVLVKRETTEGFQPAQEVPHPDCVLRQGDSILLMGRSEDLKKIPLM